MQQTIDIVPFTVEDAAALADWITSQSWPFHGGTPPTPEMILDRVARGVYLNDRTRTFWGIDDQGEKVGLIQLRDIGDSSPNFDLRIRHDRRGTGLGEQALRWLTGYLFTELPEIRRIEGTTRADNVAMRKLFGRCGYAKEAHYRSAWPDGDVHHDAVGYAILRDDWLNGTITPPRLPDEPA